MSTRDYFKMQSINFCYMCFMLQATNQKTMYINGTYIQDIMMDEDDTILAVMQDGEVIPAIDIDPNQSTHDIKQWTDNYPSLHEKVLMLMEAQWFGMMVYNLGTISPLTIGFSAENQWGCLSCCQS